MSSPKTYNGKFNRVKDLMDQSFEVHSAVTAFAKSNPDQDAFNSLQRLCYLEMKEALQQKGMNTQRQIISGKSEKSAASMAFTLAGWLQTELFPESRQDSCLHDVKFYRAMQDGVGIIDFYEQQSKDPHQSIKYAEGTIREKLGIDMRSRKEILNSIAKRLTA